MTLLPSNHAQQIELAGGGNLTLTLHARDLERTARFYARLFGFRVVEDRRGSRDAQVLLGAHGAVFLVLRERGDIVRSGDVVVASGGAPPKRCVLVVKDLELAREALWNQGVVPVGGGRVPTSATGRRPSLLIEDPDGHEIELVEATTIRVGGVRWMHERARHLTTCLGHLGARTAIQGKLCTARRQFR